jgi:hypothetical protein
MANKNKLTNGAKISQIQLNYYAPAAVVPPQIDIPLGTTYCFLSKVDPWDDENNPPAPSLDQKSLKKIFKSMFVAKLITSSDISPVIQRIDWTIGTTYTYYRDDIDMFEQDQNGNLIYQFYVKNKYDQVFKCLWNNNGTPSTLEPYFEPGTYTTNNIFKGTDGYKWKYIYTIDTGLKVKFMDKTWIPVPVGANTPNPLISSAGAGSIDVINVLNKGSGYDPANAVVYVTITGDGSGAAATANVAANGAIQDIIVSSAGSNYTYADIQVVSQLGSGANVYGPTSPIGGHGFDPLSELGCSHAMFTVEFNGGENGLIPTDIDFHQLGLITAPTAQDVNPYPAAESIYSTTTDFVVAPGADTGYVMDELIYQGPIDKPTFFGTVLSFDVATNVAKVLNMTGTPTNNAPIFGLSSKTTRTLLSYNPPNFVILSGYMSFIENRTGIQRSADGIEQFRFVIGY